MVPSREAREVEEDVEGDEGVMEDMAEGVEENMGEG